MADKKKVWIGLIALILGTLGNLGLMFLVSNFINDEIDWNMLLVINPDVYIPILNELMVFITNCSMAIFAVGFIFWEIGYATYRKDPSNPQNQQKAVRLVIIMGIIIAIIGAIIIFIKYEYKTVGIVFAAVVIVGFWMLGKTYVKLKIEYLDRFSVAMTMIIISIVLNAALSEQLIKYIVQRWRPMNDYYSSYNTAVVLIEDAITRSGYSYVSGHSSALFALVTPIVFLVKDRKIKGTLIVWAALHALSRVYVAAHFPLCITMGSIMGIIYGTLAYFVVSYWFPQGLQYLMEKNRK